MLLPENVCPSMDALKGRQGSLMDCIEASGSVTVSFDNTQTGKELKASS
jgi:hypothetical protein